MKDIFNQLYGNNGCVVIKVAQPVNKNTPKAVQDLGFVHYEKDKNKTYDAAIKEFKEMSDIDYEYSRLGIYCAIEHIMEDLHEVKSGFGQLVSFKSATDVFVGLFDNMLAYFDEVKTTKTKKINKKMITAEIEAIASYVEGVLFLKEVAKKDAKIIPLIEKYENIQQELLTMLESHQQTFKLTKHDYKIIEATDIFNASKAEMELSMKFNYNSLNYDDLERILIAVGDKKEYWHALQDEKKWETLYEDNSRQSLSQDSVEQLRSQLPLMLEQYKSLHHLSFTNMVKVLLVASSYYGSLIGSRNEKAPKDDKEFKEHEMMRDKDFELKKKESFYTPIRKEVQTPERTLENLQFASEILAASMTVSALIDNACGLTDSNQACLVLERFNDEYDIVKMTNSNLAIILTKDKAHIHGDLVDVIDLENINMPTCIKKMKKGTSFSGMTHFLREIKEPFVQEYFFGQQDKPLSFVDNRQ